MIFAYPSDLLGADATLTADSGTVDADYPLTNLADQRPTEVCRFTSNGLMRIIWDFGAATPVEGAIIVMHNVPEGAAVEFAANTTDTWVSPAVTHTVTVLPWEHGLPVNIAADLRETAFQTTGFRYLSMAFPAQTDDFAFGTIYWIREWQVLDRAAVGEVTLADIRRLTVNQTSFGVTHVIDRSVRQRRLKLSFKPSVADLTKMRSLFRDAAGCVSAWPVVLHSNEDGTVESEPVYFVTVDPGTADELEETWVELPFYGTRDLDIVELQRGLAL